MNENIIDLQHKKIPPQALPEESEEPEFEETDESYTNNALEWEAPEYFFYEKSSQWFSALFLVAGGLIIAAIILQNFLLAAFIAIASFTLALYSAKKPEIVHVRLSGMGVQIGHRLFPYATLESYWIFYDPPELKELSIRSEKTFSPYIKIPIGEADPVAIKRFLDRYLPEEAQEEQFIDTITRYLKL